MKNIRLNNTDITHLVTSFEIYEEMNEDTVIGGAISTQIKLTLKNKDDQLKGLLDYPFFIGDKSYIAYQKPETWTNKVSLVLYDLMICTNIPYDTKLTYPVTVCEQLDEMSSLCGIEIDKATLSNDVLSKEVNWYDNTIIIRNYLGWIAECDGKNAFIEEDKIVFRALAESEHEIDFCSNYELNELITFSRVCFDPGTMVPLETGIDSGKTLYLSKDNSYVVQSDVERVHQMYAGLSFYSFKKFKCKEINHLKLTHLITYRDFSILPMSIKTKVNGGIAKDSLELSGNITLKNVESIVVKENYDARIKRIQMIVNQNNASMSVIAKDVANNKESIGKLEVSNEKISTEVSKKVGNDEIISKINQSAEEVKIQAPKISLEGIITANGNIKILEDGSIEAKNGKFTGKIEGSSFNTIKTSEYTYNDSDLDKVYEIINSQYTPTEEQLAKYDIDNNGIINDKDYYLVYSIIDGSFGETNGKAFIEDIISINVENNGIQKTERRINGTRISYMEFRSGSINTNGGSILVDGEPVVTSLGGTIARFG